MFIVELTYLATLEEIDAAMQEHMKFLNKYYKKGIFLISGRKIPRKGGIIIGRATNKETILKIAREDPFYKKGLSKFKLIEFNASQSADVISSFLK